MNANEAAELLAHASSFDNRQPSLAAATAWAAALNDVPLDADAKTAVAAYYTTPPQDPNQRLWILPHHVRTLRTKIRNARLENFQYEPVGDETTPEYLARYRGQVRAIASGRIAPPTSRPALEGAPSKNFMRQLEARGWEGNRTIPDTDSEPLADAVRRSGPLGVQCPVCSAEIGFPCKGGRATAKHPIGKPLPKPHTARTREAVGEPQPTAEQRAAEEQRIRDASARALARLAAEENIPDADIVDEVAS
ncbi:MULTISPECIES: hypothetical protein [unclassified Streptomyces]|uniref:zinc finger domain-containing protein n=1 Tax=unclassified Streptomyces TaxID=2593676 RepID=UPI00081DFA19|nr:MULTISPECIES: hypothetical protein [unclassified Streptomyces]MYZ37102.1 hypothetical protein [Streptomyces sp. SID4917]SCF88678.1 hypothetical protein GA0115259_104222 [Streptomyces sp. MnatMP-M17]